MNDKKKIYTKADFDNYVAAVDKEVNGVLVKQRERIEELKAELEEAEKKIEEYESRKDLIQKAITAALSKAEDIERVSLIKYNQEIAQLKSFHDKWTGYFDKILAAYPLDDELMAANRANARISDILDKSGDIEGQYRFERGKLKQSLDDEEKEQKPKKKMQKRETAAADDYADRSPAGFSFAEALHPKEDLKDIMKELGIAIEE